MQQKKDVFIYLYYLYVYLYVEMSYGHITPMRTLVEVTRHRGEDIIQGTCTFLNDQRGQYSCSLYNVPSLIIREGSIATYYIMYLH